MNDKDRAILLDFDGVIVDSVDIKAGAFAKIYENESEDRIREILEYQHQHGGVSRREKFRHFERNIFHRSPSDDDIERLSERFTAIVHDAVVGCDYIPGAVQALERLSSDFALFAISGTPEVELRAIIEARELSLYFTGIYGAPTTKPEAFRDVLAFGKYSPRQCYAVGDSRTEHDAAMIFDIPFITISRDMKSNFESQIAMLPDLVDLPEFVFSRI